MLPVARNVDDADGAVDHPPASPQASPSSPFEPGTSVTARLRANMPVASYTRCLPFATVNRVCTYSNLNRSANRITGRFHTCRRMFRMIGALPPGRLRVVEHSSKTPRVRRIASLIYIDRKPAEEGPVTLDLTSVPGFIDLDD